MSDTKNPFEQAMSASCSEFDPFAQGAADPFGSVPTATQNAAPPPDLGSRQTSANPFETPAVLPAGTPPAAPAIDLGSQPGAAAPFTAEEQPAAPAKQSEAEQLAMFSAASGSEASKGNDAVPSEAVNPIEAAMAKQEQSDNLSIFAKPPVFEHGAVKEPIANPDQTFEDLRVAKSDDFPELEDAIRVSWDVTYGKIKKTVPAPKKTKIGDFKKSIETSKEFLDALKKDKDKSPDCIIKPKITAQSKGEQMPLYKGVFTSLEDAEASNKIICIVPGSDGKVYEIRNEEAGRFITPSGECRELSEIEAGFTPALPLIPHYELRRIIGFFRSFMTDGGNFEAIANIYWDREREEYRVVIPRQHVTAVRADSELSDDYDPERFLHYMDIHSHNIMPARFSGQDDRDEKATRLYAVIGKLNEFIPELSVRISNGGKYLLIDPATVFESFGDYYPVEWNDQVTFDTRDCELPEDNDTTKLQCFLRSFGRKGRMCA